MTFGTKAVWVTLLSCLTIAVGYSVLHRTTTLLVNSRESTTPHHPPREQQQQLQHTVVVTTTRITTKSLPPAQEKRKEKQYLVYIPKSGLGNRLLTLASAYLFAWLTSRTLVVLPITQNTSELLDFAHPTSSSLFPPPEILTAFNPHESHAWIQKTGRFLDIAFHKKSDGTRKNDWNMLCNMNLSESYPEEVIRVVSNQYYAPLFFVNPFYKSMLQNLFPEVYRKNNNSRTLFRMLSESLWQPSSAVHLVMKRFYQSLSMFPTVGVQIRIFSHQYVAACEAFWSCAQHSTTNNNTASYYLASMNTLTRQCWTHHTQQHKRTTHILTQQTATEVQQTGHTTHDVFALADMLLLGGRNIHTLWISPKSTFGYVALALATNPTLRWGVVDLKKAKSAAVCSVFPQSSSMMSREPCFDQWFGKDKVVSMVSKDQSMPTSLLRQCGAT
eukprot:PhF_6_TR8713/c0_g1_i1/m.13671/K13681/FUT; xyloglucan fucosyltransferase